MLTLGDISHSRAGDKGDTSIIVLAVHEGTAFAQADRALTEEAVARHFTVTAPDVVIHRIPNLGVFIVSIGRRLDGGVTRSRTSDPHGKSLSGHLLELPLPS